MNNFTKPPEYKAETLLFSAFRIELSQKMNRIEEQNFLQLLENGSVESNLCKGILESDYNLSPKNILAIDDKIWFLPEKLIRAMYTAPLREDKANGYLQFVCYVKDGDTLYPRTFYKSNTDGNWRAGIVRYDDGRGFSKGDEVVNNYTQTNKPCSELTIYLEGISVKYDYKKRAYDNISPTRDWGFLEYEFQVGGEQYEKIGGYKNVNTFNQEVLGVFDDNGELKDVQYFEISKFTKKDVELYGGVEKLKEGLYSLVYPKDFIPDFSKSPTKIIEYYHTVLGVTRTETYKAILNGKPIEWNISYDKAGRVWIDSIISVDSGITTYGTQKIILQAGILNSKPIDYTFQVNGLPKITNTDEGEDTFGIIEGKDGRYSDFSLILDVLQPIVTFRSCRKIKSIVGQTTKDVKEIEWPDIKNIRNYFRSDNSSGEAASWETFGHSTSVSLHDTKLEDERFLSSQQKIENFPKVLSPGDYEVDLSQGKKIESIPSGTQITIYLGALVNGNLYGSQEVTISPVNNFYSLKTKDMRRKNDQVEYVVFLKEGEEIILGRSYNQEKFPIWNENEFSSNGLSYVSRKHVVIRVKDGRCIIEDLNSANGTFISFVIPESPKLLPKIKL